MKRIVYILSILVVVLLSYSCKKEKSTSKEVSPYEDTLAKSQDSLTDSPFIVESNDADTVKVYSEDSTGKLKPVKVQEKLAEGSHKIYIIVGSFKNYENAQKKVAQLQKLGYSAEILPKYGEYNRVSIASFTSEQIARQELKKFRAKFKDNSIWLLLR